MLSAEISVSPARSGMRGLGSWSSSLWSCCLYLFCVSSIDVGCVLRFLLLVLSDPLLAIVLSLSVCSCVSECVSDGTVVDVDFVYESIVFRCVLCCPRTPRCCLDFGFGFGFADVPDLGWLSLRCS